MLNTGITNHIFLHSSLISVTHNSNIIGSLKEEKVCIKFNTIIPLYHICDIDIDWLSTQIHQPALSFKLQVFQQNRVAQVIIHLICMLRVHSLNFGQDTRNTE